MCKKGKITAHGHHPDGDVGLKKLNFLSLLQTLVTHDFIAPSSSVYFPGEIKEHRISQGCLVPVYELTQLWYIQQNLATCTVHSLHYDLQ